MKIGSVILRDRPLILAPMEEVTDPPFRFFCKRFGADLMFSEFVSSEALIRGVSKTVLKLEIDPGEHPYAIQLYGRSIASMVESAIIAAEQRPDIIDLNFGCPVKKVALKGAGAGMLRDVPMMIKMTREIVRAIALPVTVKTRLGWDQESRNIVQVAERLQDTGIRAISIHGRTREQLYRGEADWTLIGEVKNNPRMVIPVIGNGDISTPQRAREVFDRYGVDGVMIGRAAIGRPWIFREIRHHLNTGELLPPPLVSEQVELVREHLNRVLRVREERKAIVSMRRFFAVAFKSLADFRETRIRLLQVSSLEEVIDVLDLIRDRWGDQPVYSSAPVTK